MNINAKVNELFDFALSRRTSVRGSVAGGTVALATTAGLGRAFAQGLTDTDILQFALTLEHLEARMYAEMLATNILTGKEKSYFTMFGDHEAAHVKAITSTLTQMGATPVAAQSSYNFPPFNNRGDILNFAKMAEDIGVGAYQGAAAAITNKAILAAAGSIVQVEARHAAIINLLSGLDPVPSATTSSLTIDEVNAKVGPVLIS
ncbi:MAG: ferritin-like domain-containing protein [Caldilineaceae bacterium]